LAGVNGKVKDEVKATGAVVTGRRTFELADGWGGDHHDGNTIFVGEHFDRAEDVGFERLVVEYLHLDAWAHETGFEINVNEEVEEPKRRWTEVRHELPEPFTADVGGEYEVTVYFGSDFEASRRPFT
jgi:ApeA N-terminal domain 1